MILTLLAAAHLYVLPSKVLFLLPAPAKSCAVTSLRFGPPDGKWERGSNLPAPDCEFRQRVEPGGLLAAWADAEGPAVEGAINVTYTVQGSDQPQTAPVQAEKLQPKVPEASQLSARAIKVKSSVRVEVTNKSDQPLLLGDSVAARNRPKDACLGPGPAAVLAPGETLVDIRPGLLSKSMKVWVAGFSDEKTCKWVEVRR